MTLKPFRDICLIKADAPKEKTDSGLLLQENWKTLPLSGEVLAIGPEVRSVKPGDRVSFMQYSSVMLENNERFVPVNHIYGILHD